VGVEARRTCMAEWWRNSGRLSVLGWRTWPGTDSRPRPELLVMYGAISSLFFSRPLICRASAV